MMSHQPGDQPSSVALIPNPGPAENEVRDQVGRVLSSETLRASEGLRRLLKFLAEKTLSGEADHLKEYSVGLDGLGKPPGYDPRHDAGVRLQASRLRQKLDDYYRNEGRDDSLIIELPKGGFKIVWRARGSVEMDALPAAGVPETIRLSPHAQPTAPTADPRKWRSLVIALTATTLLFACLSLWLAARMARNSPAAPPESAPEIEALWSPFLTSRHHIVIAYTDPMFVRFERKGGPDIVYRRRETLGWADAVKSPEFSVLRRSLGNPEATPTFDYVSRSNLLAIFALSRFFDRYHVDVSLSTQKDMSWQEFADNDVIILAPRYNLDERQSALPIRAAFVADKAGIRNLQPLAGEPSLYEDAPEHANSDGETLELVSVMPGPLARTKILSFTGNRAWGVLGGVQSLTDPAFARIVVQKLKGASGTVPPFYQVIIRIRFRDGTPTNASFVTDRELTPAQNPPTR